MFRDSDWYWHPAAPDAGTRSTIAVLVPDPSKTIVPFGFSRALLDPEPAPDGWTEHAEAVAGGR